MKIVGSKQNVRNSSFALAIFIAISGWGNMISLKYFSLKEHTITIQVLNSNTKLPVPWATVFSKKNGYGVVADKEGFCQFIIDSKNDDTLLVSSIGYHTMPVASNTVLTQQVNKIYLEPFALTNEPVVVNSKKEPSGFELIKQFKKNYSNKYPQNPFSGNIYVSILTKQDTVTVRNAEYVSGFYCSTGYQKSLISSDTLLKLRTAQEINVKDVIPNPTTAGIVSLQFLFPFQGIDHLPEWKRLTEKNTTITSVTSFLFNGVKIYKVKASLKEPLLFTKRISRMEIELFLSGLNFSVIKYKLAYTVYFDNSDGRTDCIDLNGNRIHCSTPAGFIYDSIKNTKEVFFQQSDKGYLPFYCITNYNVWDQQTATGKKGWFEERREYFIFGTTVYDEPAKSTARGERRSFLANRKINDEEFWRSFVKPDKQMVMQYLTDINDASQ